ncbi:hypothetical protein PoB_002583500 [Plakobranchus ocellatus]|uniref:Uncharacterized protein n=1 Tax=Plakobranchus ocellatus TaxID=259542 RepID=A0AAV3ZVX6_9GAST|nr:hypothetical protein PoB_002583500 [Plakobranchus ocellatus]
MPYTGSAGVTSGVTGGVTGGTIGGMAGSNGSMAMDKGQGSISFSTWLLSSIPSSFPALSSRLLLLLMSSTSFSSHVESGIESTHRTVRVVRDD